MDIYRVTVEKLTSGEGGIDQDQALSDLKAHILSTPGLIVYRPDATIEETWGVERRADGCLQLDIDRDNTGENEVDLACLRQIVEFFISDAFASEPVADLETADFSGDV